MKLGLKPKLNPCAKRHDPSFRKEPVNDLVVNRVK